MRDKHESIIFRRDNSHYESVVLKKKILMNLFPFRVIRFLGMD